MTLKISLVSDTHLEFSPLQMPGGDLLILAGDICEYRTLYKQLHSTSNHENKMDSHDFFFHECAKYKQVFYVLGNHEFYHNRFDTTYDDLKAILPSNVTLLENETVEYEGVMFMGATLWTDLNKSDPITEYILEDTMNDYKVVKTLYPETGSIYKMTPKHTYKVHHETLEYFKKTLNDNANKPFVVITHHGPTYLSINEKYKGEYHLNGGYVSDLSEFILDHPNIKVMCHGHMHDPVSYMIGDTRVVSNPRGYVGHEDTSQFDPNFYFEV